MFFFSKRMFLCKNILFLLFQFGGKFILFYRFRQIKTQINRPFLLRFVCFPNKNYASRRKL